MSPTRASGYIVGARAACCGHGDSSVYQSYISQEDGPLYDWELRMYWIAHGVRSRARSIENQKNGTLLTDSPPSKNGPGESTLSQ